MDTRYQNNPDALGIADLASNRMVVGGSHRASLPIEGALPAEPITAEEAQRRLDALRAKPVEKGAVCGRIIPGKVRVRPDGKFEEYHATKGWRINKKLGRKTL